MSSALQDEERGAQVRAPRAEATTRGVVVTYPSGNAASHTGHMAATRNEIARHLATLTGFAYAGDYDALRHRDKPTYFVPSETMTTEMAAHAGVSGESDLFGGVVPHPFVATKTITHPLVDVGSRAPIGWCAEFPRRVADVVLEGFSAFAKEDALAAGRKLLEHGRVRVKPGAGIAGLGQSVVDNVRDLGRALDALEPEAMARSGVVVEQDLADVTTYSIGQVHVADLIGTYYGTQYVTTNNHGAEVYGGSEITVVRGDFDALTALALPEDVVLAIAQARVYDAAASQCFTGFYASRRNYDVAQGRDGAGRHRSGVLEQSWRLGGASGAEIGALEAFRADPSLEIVRAITREVYGEAPALPPTAVVYFSGVDASVGALTKYALTEPHAHAR
ncbi:MAG: DUF3182 family protein [Casimicrobiaceae bacterium]